MDTAPPLVIFGCGYVGGYLARAALDAGQRVRACARNVARLQPLAEAGENWSSRIHVLDLVDIIRAASDHAPPGSLYCVADDRPAKQREYALWLCDHLSLPPPPETPPTGHPSAHRGRRIRN